MSEDRHEFRKNTASHGGYICDECSTIVPDPSKYEGIYCPAKIAELHSELSALKAALGRARVEGMNDAIAEFQKAVTQGAKWQEALGAVVFYANNLPAPDVNAAPVAKTEERP